MAKVTLNSANAPTPVAAPETVETVDAQGRILTLKKPGVLAQFRLVEALGDSAKNETYMGMVFPLLFVSAVDGEPVPQPRSKGEVEALIQRLGDDGIAALMVEIPKHFGAEAQADTAKKSAE